MVCPPPASCHVNLVRGKATALPIRPILPILSNLPFFHILPNLPDLLAVLMHACCTGNERGHAGQLAHRALSEVVRERERVSDREKEYQKCVLRAALIASTALALGHMHSLAHIRMCACV